MKTQLAPGAPWPEAKPQAPVAALLKPKRPVGRPKKLTGEALLSAQDPLRVARDQLNHVCPSKLKKVLFKAFVNDKREIVKIVPVRPAYQPERAGMHNYKGQYANIWTEGFRAAEKLHKIGTSKKRTK